MNKNEKMVGKDYITCGIFSALCIVIMLISSVMNITGYTALFYPAVVAFFVGILLVVLNSKVQKRGAIFIFSIIPCAYFFTSGVIEGIFGAIGLLIFATLAEVILWKNHNDIKKIILSSVVYVLNLATVGFAQNFLNTETYCANALAHGINETVVEQMRMLYSIKPLWIVVIAATALLGFVGAILGKKLMKKHLKRAGII